MSNKKSEGKYSSPVAATLKGISDLFKSKTPDVFVSENDRLDGKTVVITGASSGLGFAAAKRIAEKGARVVMACRSGIPERGNEIMELTGNQQVEMVHVDVSDPESIESMIKELQLRNIQIDILILNAAIVPSGSRKTKEGFEEMFMVNYLAKFIIMKRLREESMFISRPRIIIVSSESHRNPQKFEWDKFGFYEEYKMGKVVERYGYFKLLLTTFAQELANQYQEAKVYTLCPGPVNSNIAREAPKAFQPLLKLTFSLFFRSPEKASDPVVYFASSSDKIDSGKYLFLMNWKEVDSKANDEENRKRLWKESGRVYEELKSASH